eukprot:s2187_g3.t1
MVIFPEPQVQPSRTGRTMPAGLEVLAFYHSNLHPDRQRPVHICSNDFMQPLAGLSSGWLMATVLRDKWPEDERVLVRFKGPFCDALNGMARWVDMRLPESLVCPVGVLGQSPPPLPPLLSVLVVRWWDYRVNPIWSDFAVTNDGMLRDLVDGPSGIFPVLAGDFEVYTVFVQKSEDLDSISENWVQAVLQGLNTVAWYFLWPCQRADADTMPGCVNERRFFSLQQRMERAGLRSGWPHPSTLYRQLCGKLWLPQMSLNKEWRVPTTVKVQFADVRRDAEAAAKKAIDALLLIGAKQNTSSIQSADGFYGVAKLGFSWQGDDVLPFAGILNLSRVLQRLLNQPGGEQLHCFVQELVPDVVCEHRVLCFRDEHEGPQRFVREHLWLRMKTRGEHHNHQATCILLRGPPVFASKDGYL